MIQSKQFTVGGVLRRVDGLTILLYVGLVLMGWFNIYAAVFNEESSSIFDIGFRYGKQMLWIIAAFFLAISLIIIDSKFYPILSYPIYAIVLILLVFVMFTGATKGASSWFQIGSFKFQPAEFAKVATALVVARYLSGYNVKITNLRHIIRIAILVVIPMGLIVLQGDPGSALVFGSFLFVFYREGMPGWILLLAGYVILLFAFSIIYGTFSVTLAFFVLMLIALYFIIRATKLSYLILIPTVIAGILPWIIDYAFVLELSDFLLFGITLVLLIIPTIIYSYRKKVASILILLAIAIGSFGLTYSVGYIFDNILESHHQTRIRVLFGLESDPQGAEFNLIQSKIAIGSGGFSGKGYLQGTQTKNDFVPEQSTDFIFCTVGEEWGFVGVFVVIGLFLFLILRLIFLAERQRSRFSRIYGYSVAVILFFHLLINIGMTIGLMPVIGIPLPFFSYGGSSLWAFTILLFIFIKLDADRDIIIH